MKEPKKDRRKSKTAEPTEQAKSSNVARHSGEGLFSPNVKRETINTLISVSSFCLSVYAVNMTYSQEQRARKDKERSSIQNLDSILNPKKRSQDIHLGYEILKPEDLDSAFKKARLLTEDNPNSSASFLAKGTVLEARGNSPLALVDYQKGLDLAKTPTSKALALRKIATLHADQSRHEIAADFFEKSINLNPEDPITFYNYALSKQQSNNYSKAIHLYTKSLHFNLSLNNGYINRGICYFQMQQPELAIKDFKTACDLDPESPVPLLKLAQALNTIEKKALAEHFTRKCLAIKPDLIDAQILLGEILEQTSRPKEAFDLYLTVCKKHLDPLVSIANHKNHNTKDLSKKHTRTFVNQYNQSLKYSHSNNFQKAADELNHAINIGLKALAEENLTTTLKPFKPKKPGFDHPAGYVKPADTLKLIVDTTHLQENRIFIASTAIKASQTSTLIDQPSHTLCLIMDSPTNPIQTPKLDQLSSQQSSVQQWNTLTIKRIQSIYDLIEAVRSAPQNYGLHILAHGIYIKENQKCFLFTKDFSGNQLLIDSKNFASIIQNCNPILPHFINIAACEAGVSLSQPNTKINDFIVPLQKIGISHIIVSPGELSQKAADEFSYAFFSLYSRYRCIETTIARLANTKRSNNFTYLNRKPQPQDTNITDRALWLG